MLKTISSITNALGALNYKGTWNALTNSPTLADGTGSKGDYYVTSTAGTQTFGGLLLFFGIGDWIAYNGSVWQRVEGGSDGNFANITLNSTDAGASAAPLLDLYRDSASPAASDTLGEIEFNGEDSAGNKQQYGLIHASIISPTSGAEGGQLHFETATGGASTEKMIIGTTNLVINEIGAVYNVRIEGDTDANLLFTDATNDRVGIGTISPSTKLQVNGTITTTSIVDSALTSGRVTYAGTSGVLQDSAGLTYDGTNLTTTGTATATRFIPSGSTVATNGMYLPAANTLGFSTNSTNVVTINSAGGVGLGATSIPAYTRLQVTGTAGLQTDAKQQMTIDGPSTTANEGAGIRINAASGAKESVGTIGVVNNATGNLGSMTFHVYNGGANVPERMRISNGGIVTMSAYGAGAATFDASGVISSVSDETWKVKAGVPTNPDVMLQKLEPGYWFYNDEKKETFSKDRQLGFYAQNVHEAIGEEAAPTPETYTDKDREGNETSITKPWGYYDRSVLAIAVMSLKNALTTIEELKQRIEVLENK